MPVYCFEEHVATEAVGLSGYAVSTGVDDIQLKA